MDYEKMTNAELLRLRRLPENRPSDRQAFLAPLEHRAFAREWVQEQPLLAIPSLLAAIPGYSAAKALGLQKARTPASLNEMAEAYRGLGEGVKGLLSF